MWNNKLRTFLFFFIISALLWILSQMGKTYVYTYKIPVQYNHLPDRFYKGFLPHDTLSVQAKTNGYLILKNEFEPPVFTLDIKKNNLLFQKKWQPEKFKYQINALLGEQVQIISIKPKTILFRIKAVHKKKVSVKADVQIHYKPGFKSRSMAILKPDSIWIYGDKPTIDTISIVKTRHYDIKDVSEDVSKMIKIKKIAGVKFNFDAVSYQLPVGEIIENTITLPIVIKGAPKDLNVLLFPQKIKLKYKIFKNKFKQIVPSDFQVWVSYKPEQNQWQPFLGRHPKGTFDFSIFPDKITYLIKK